MRVCVFCGSSPGRGSVYAEAARHLGRTLAEQGIGVVYGGASVGTMGGLADAALGAGGEVLGVIPRTLVDREIAHPGLTRLDVVDGMHERKARMAELSDAFVGLPGGAGTLEELLEVWTRAQLGLHAKPIGLVNVAGYFDGFQALTAHMLTEGFLTAAHREMLIVEQDTEALLERLTTYMAPGAERNSAPGSAGAADTRH